MIKNGGISEMFHHNDQSSLGIPIVLCNHLGVTKTQTPTPLGSFQNN